MNIFFIKLFFLVKKRYFPRKTQKPFWNAGAWSFLKDNGTFDNEYEFLYPF